MDLGRGMSGYGTRPTGTTGRTARTRSRRETGRDDTNPRAPIYRKYVKRREKTETTRCPGTSTQASADPLRTRGAGTRGRTPNTGLTMIGAR